VPIYIDGVYVSLQATNAFQLSNVKRIEILKGPQGTLFGRNAVGGAINILTKDPGTKFEGNVAASYGSFNERSGELYVSAPLSDTWRANLSVFGSADDGYISDIVRGGKANPVRTVIARSKLVWAPDENTEFKLTANYTNVKDSSGVVQHPVDGVTVGRTTNPPAIIAGEYQAGSNEVLGAKFMTKGASFQAQRRLAAFTLNALASYQYSRSQTKTDADSSTAVTTSAAARQSDKTYTAEIRATSTSSGPIGWIVGAYYFKDTACYCHNVNAGQDLVATQRSDAYAIFGEGSYDFDGRLKLSAGLRYSDESRSIYTVRNNSFLGSASKKFAKLSPRASITYSFDDRARVYFTYSQGFKSGLYNASSTALPLTAVDPEVLNSYELGLKSEPARSVRFNLSAYYYDYKGLQVVSRNIVTNTTFLQNAASAEMYGLEGQLDYAASPSWNIYLAASYNHAQFIKFPGAQILTVRADRAGTTASFIDAAGKTVPRTPAFSANVRSDYTVPLGYGSLKLSGNVYYSSSFYFDFGNIFRSPAYVAANAQIAWTSPKGNLRLIAFVQNLTDNDRPLNLSIAAQAVSSSEVRPRVFGGKVEYSF
jgi:iron complex outermembrane receptor protein